MFRPHVTGGPPWRSPPPCRSRRCFPVPSNLAAGDRYARLVFDAHFAAGFAKEWEAAWNSHDVERILLHYADDVVFQSPYIVHRLGDPSGEVRGKDALRSYWASGLEAQPNLRFTVEDVRLSVDTIAIDYRNDRRHAVTEILRFRGDLVIWGCGAYSLGRSLSATSATSASARRPQPTEASRRPSGSA